MTTQSVIEIEVEDGPFKEFLELFRKYREAVKALPPEFRTSALAAEDITDEIEKSADAAKTLNRALTAQAQATDEASRAAAGRRAEAIRQAMEIMDHEKSQVALERERAALEREIAQNRREAGKLQDKDDQRVRKEEMDHRKATEVVLGNSQKLTKDMLGSAQSVAKIFGGAAGGILAGGTISAAVTGWMEAMTQIGSQRTEAQGLNATAGDVKAFSADLGRLGLDPSFLGQVRDMANDPARSSMFGPMGIDPAEVAAARRTGDYGQLTADVLMAGNRIVRDTDPDSRSPQFFATTGLGTGGLGLDLSQLATLGAQTPEDMERYTGNFLRDRKTMNVNDPTQKSFQDLTASISRFTGDFEAAFFSNSGMGVKLTKMVDDLDEIVKNKGWTGVFTADVPNLLPEIPHEDTLPAQLHRMFPWIPDWGIRGRPAAPNGQSAPFSSPVPGGVDVLQDGTAKLTPAQYQLYFAKLEDAAKLPRGLLGGLANNESSYNPHPQDTWDGPGNERHAGMFQMSATMLRKYGITDPYDVNQVAPAAAMEEAGYLRHYHGNVAEALAAWNRGEPGVDADIRAGGGTADGFLSASSPKVQGYLERAIQEMIRIQSRPQQIKVVVENRSGANVHVSANALAPQ